MIQPLDALLVQQKSVRDHSGNHPAAPDVPDDVVQVRVQQRFAPADGDDRTAHVRQEIQALLHLVQRHRRREIVVFIAIGAGQVASPSRDDMHEEGMLRGNQRLRDRAHFAHARVEEAQRAPEPHFHRRM